MPAAIEQEVDAFLAHLRIERALASNTVIAYGTDLSELLSSLRKPEAAQKSPTRASEIELSHLHEWLRGLGKLGRSPRTMSRKLSSVRGFFHYCHSEGLVREDLSRLLDRPRTTKPLPRTEAPAELLTLLERIETSSLRGLRDRALLSLMYSSGLRVSEATELSVDDLDFRSGTVRPQGKGAKRRLVPVSPVTLTHVEDYLQARSSHARQAAATRLFCGPGGKPLTRQAVWKLVRKYGRLAGLNQELYPHALRHSFASHLLAGGADLRSVQLLLGHITIQTTEIYTHLARDHVSRAHKKAHPRGA